MDDNASAIELLSSAETTAEEKIAALTQAFVAGQEKIAKLQVKIANSGATIQSMMDHIKQLSIAYERMGAVEKANQEYNKVKLAYENEILLLREKVTALEGALASTGSSMENKEAAVPYQDMRYIALYELFPGKKRKTTPPTAYIERSNGTIEQIPYRIQTDENGFVVSNKELRKGDIKILLLGGSSIENMCVQEGSRIADCIEKYFEAGEKSAKVYNGSRDGGNLLFMLNSVVNKGIPLRPKYTVYYPTINDAGANGLQYTFWNPFISPIRTMGLEAASKTYGESVDNYYQDIKGLLSLLCDTCTNFDGHLFLSTWPLYGPYDEFMKKFNDDKRDDFDVCEWMIQNLNTVIREVSRKKKCGLIDLEEKFNGLDHHKYFYDWYHPNAEGCAYIGKITSEAIEASFKDTAP